ncbi:MULTISPECIES: hypothetical protein [Chryseobacterium]|uniref:hypothetical protein n=1 Tax=Chryseobacterium TaxID=59732 RepID=UPI0014096611|nr:MULTISPECIES: hypothetical protein [Chryseobacterium]MDQ0475706.1 hypothetical protein [Chryseobacterium sp. MDT2-18]
MMHSIYKFRDKFLDFADKLSKIPTNKNNYFPDKVAKKIPKNFIKNKTKKNR